MARIVRLILLVALLAPTAPIGSTTAVAQPTPAPAWWDPPAVRGPEDFRHGWNLRAPFEVHNSQAYPLPAGATALAHLDLGQLAVDAGWPSLTVGSLRLPRGFTADVDSVRLVRYETDWRRLLGEVPSRTEPTWFEPDQSERFDRVQTGPFDPAVSALVTVAWRLPAPIPVGKSQYYYAYFDALENSKKPVAQYGLLDEEALDSMFWLGPGVEFFGFDPGQPRLNLEVAALHPGTQVTVMTYPPNVPAPRIDARTGAVNPFPAAAGRLTSYSRELGPGPTRFKVVSNQPIVVDTFTNPAPGGTFIPSLDGGAIGGHFIFRARSTHVFITSPIEDGDAVTQVTFRAAGTSSPLSTASLFPGETRMLPLGDDSSKEFEVLATRPVIAQFAPTGTTSGGLMQASSIAGAAVGRVFLAATKTGGFPRAAMEATGYDIDSRLEIYQSLDPALRGFPAPGEPPAKLEPGAAKRRSIATTGFLTAEGLDGSTPVTLARGATCEELACRSDEVGGGRFSLMVGEAGGRLGSAFGGRAGLAFEAFGPVLVFAHFDATHVSFELPQEGRKDDAFLDADMPLEIRPLNPTSVPRPPVSIRSDKPVAVFPLDWAPAYVSYLPAGILPADVRVHRGELRGFLVGLSSPLGEDPIFLAARPGETLRVPLEIHNLGRWSDGRLFSDTVQLEVVTAPPDWPGTARADPSQVTLDSGATQTSDLIIQIPEGPSSTLGFTITARSGTNPNIATDLQIIVLVQRTFGVRLWFGESFSTFGDRTTQVRMPLRSERIIGVVLQNTGSGIDTFRLQVTPPGGQWTAQILRDGEPVERIENVPAGARVPLQLRLTSPGTEELASVAVPLDAISAGSESAADRITAFASLSLGLDVSLRAPIPFAELDAGGNATFPLTINNEGKEPIRVRLRLILRSPTGWATTFLGEVDGPHQTELTLFPRQSQDVQVRVTAPAGTLAKQSGSILVLAEAGNEALQLADSQTLVASVRPFFRLSASSSEPGPLPPSAVGTIGVRIVNGGNAPTHVRVTPQGVPAGWDGAGQEITLAPKATANLKVSVEIPAGAVAGTYDVKLFVEGSGDTSASITVPVVVVRVFDFDLANVTARLVPPGEAFRLGFQIVNRGNGPETLVLIPEPPAGWEVSVTPAEVRLAHAGHATLRIDVAVPANAPDGMYELPIRARSLENGDTSTLTVPVEVARPAVSVASAVIAGAGDGYPGDVLYVMAKIRNQGRVPAVPVLVQLHRNGTAIDEVQVERLPPGQEAIVTLRATVAESKDLVVVADPGQVLPEMDRGDNALPVSQASRVLKEPSLLGSADAVFIAALALFVALLVRRRLR